mmetsp:Transcript_65417/g.181501  ORF Transcript_65417/g.181501 Transcript_65417/m.181501 type:complete len:201 (-) Transcript_65417:29-631(-)
MAPITVASSSSPLRIFPVACISLQALVTIVAEQACGTIGLATAEAATWDRTASIEAAVVTVAAWPPALCALRSGSQAALQAEAEAFRPDGAETLGNKVGRSAAAADEGWGAGLSGVNTLDGSRVVQTTSEMYADLLGGGSSARRWAGTRGHGSLKELRPVSFTLRENHGGRTLTLPLRVHPALPMTSSRASIEATSSPVA